MKTDIVADGLNMIMNAKKVERTEVEIKKISKVLINVLEMMKDKGYITFEIKENVNNKPTVNVKILKLNYCKAIKPRYSVTVDRIDKYLRRYLPSRNFGIVIVSTNKGLMSHSDALQNKLGGSLIAYFY